MENDHLEDHERDWSIAVSQLREIACEDEILMELVKVGG